MTENQDGVLENGHTLASHHRGFGNGFYHLQWGCSMADHHFCFLLINNYTSQILFKIAVLGYLTYMYICTCIKVPGMNIFFLQM